MTEKRFNLVGSYLYDGDECVSHFDDPSHREEIVNLLNKLFDENGQLKQYIYDNLDEDICDVCIHQYLQKTIRINIILQNVKKDTITAQKEL